MTEQIRDITIYKFYKELSKRCNDSAENIKGLRNATYKELDWGIKTRSYSDGVKAYHQAKELVNKRIRLANYTQDIIEVDEKRLKDIKDSDFKITSSGNGFLANIVFEGRKVIGYSRTREVAIERAKKQCLIEKNFECDYGSRFCENMYQSTAGVNLWGC